MTIELTIILDYDRLSLHILNYIDILYLYVGVSPLLLEIGLGFQLFNNFYC